MAQVLLHSVHLEDLQIDKTMLSAHDLLAESADLDRFAAHTLTYNPNDADLIVFAKLGGQGLFAERVRHHSYVKKFRDKCFLFDPCDLALPFCLEYMLRCERNTTMRRGLAPAFAFASMRILIWIFARHGRISNISQVVPEPLETIRSVRSCKNFRAICLSSKIQHRSRSRNCTEEIRKNGIASGITSRK